MFLQNEHDLLPIWNSVMQHFVLDIPLTRQGKYPKNDIKCVGFTNLLPLLVIFLHMVDR